MAIKNCEECGKPISDQARTCPYCGKPNKKHGLVLSIISLVLGFYSVAYTFMYIYASDKLAEAADSVIGVVCFFGILSIIFGIIANKKAKPRIQTVVGISISAVSMAVMIIMSIL